MDTENLFKRFQKSCAIEFIRRIKTIELKINQKRKKNLRLFQIMQIKEEKRIFSFLFFIPPATRFFRLILIF